MFNHLRTLAAVLLVVGVIVALSSTSFAQKPVLPKYDAKTEVHIAKATVIDTKEVTLPNGQQRFRLIVKAGDETLEICLCPKKFLESMDTAFDKGDEVEITGSKVKESEDKTIILAREVTKGQNTLVLRDKHGEPVWTWMEKKSGEGK
ncbi:MAG: hypothetical protein ACXVZV_01045 [Terriglobales bacterium]